MGVLYAGRNPSLDQRVAIKVLRSDFAGPDAGERFIREARAVSQLKHPNIVRVFDFGEDDDQLYFVMEYVQGETLKTAIDRRADLSLPQRVQIFGQICDAMSYAHRAGWIHRDLKPGNIMLDDEDGLVKVLDFGLARQVDVAASQVLTRVSGIMGTPNYMSPEQATGAISIDHRTDIFAATVVLYELLTYAPAFNGKTEEEAQRAVLYADPIPPSARNGLLPSEIDEVVARGLAKSVDDRFQSIDALRTAVVGAFNRHDLLALSEQTIPRSDSRRLSDVRPVSGSRGGERQSQPATARSHSVDQSRTTVRPSSSPPASTVQDSPSVPPAPHSRSWGMVVISGVVALLSVVVGVLTWRLTDRQEQVARAPVSAPRSDIPPALVADAPRPDTARDTPLEKVEPQRIESLVRPRPDASAPSAPTETARQADTKPSVETPPPAAPPQRAPGEDRAAVQRALAQLAAAYSRLDAEGVSALMIEQPIDDFRQAFDRYTSFTMVLQPTEIVVDGDQARAVCRERRTFTTKRGNTESQPEETVHYQFQRVGNSWRIASRHVQ
jgi:serine/threonine-protein kinase